MNTRPLVSSTNYRPFYIPRPLAAFKLPALRPFAQGFEVPTQSKSFPESAKATLFSRQEVEPSVETFEDAGVAEDGWLVTTFRWPAALEGSEVSVIGDMLINDTSQTSGQSSALHPL